MTSSTNTAQQSAANNSNKANTSKASASVAAPPSNKTTANPDSNIEGSTEDETAKRIKNLKKKLKQINEIKVKRDNGEVMNSDQV